MRLTLRTLLAYMDEILEPADREELSKKVESSEFAHELIHRTKDTMRRLRLSAPQVLGSGIGLDPNTVAEYLDNVLPPDSVADFERICLESDVHLAEVASAHHVLTMVLGEPAEVDPLSRQRMYAISAEAEQRKQQRMEPAPAPPVAEWSPAAVASPPQVVSAAGVAPNRSTRAEAIPDYLRANSWTHHRLLLVGCAAVLLVAVGFLLASGMTDWFGGKTQVAGGPSNAVVTTLQSQATEAAEDERVPTLTEPDTTPAPESNGIDAAPQMSAAPPRLVLPPMGTTTIASPPATDANVARSAADSSAEESSPNAVATPVEPISPVEPIDRYADEDPVADAASATARVVPTPPQTTLTQDAPPLGPGEAQPRLVSEPDSGTVVSAAPETTASPEIDLSAGIEEVAPPEKPAELGTFIDGKEVLLRSDADAGSWFRMSPRSTIRPGETLLALPAFYPKLTLASGLHLKLAGGTLISVDSAPDNAQVPAIDVSYGKLVIVNTSNGENQVRLTVGKDTASVRLGLGATLAVEVAPKYTPGSDPRQSPSRLMIELFVREGDVVWDTAAGSMNIAAPGRWSIDDGVSTTVSQDVSFPAWIDEEPNEQRSEKQFGAPVVESALDPTRSVEEQLLELYQSSSRREVKSLVARSSVYVGVFVPFVDALRDSDQKGSWKSHIDTLRSAMSLSPDLADKVYQTLVDQRGKPAADDLYQMLCGYGPEQIGTPEAFRAGLAAQLVNWMENDSLDYRVLAVQDMADITGRKLMPNPSGPQTERVRGIRLWRQRLKAGEIAPVSP